MVALSFEVDDKNRLRWGISSLAEPIRCALPILDDFLCGGAKAFHALAKGVE